MCSFCMKPWTVQARIACLSRRPRLCPAAVSLASPDNLVWASLIRVRICVLCGWVSAGLHGGYHRRSQPHQFSQIAQSGSLSLLWSEERVHSPWPLCSGVACSRGTGIHHHISSRGSSWDVTLLSSCERTPSNLHLRIICHAIHTPFFEPFGGATPSPPQTKSKGRSCQKQKANDRNHRYQHSNGHSDILTFGHSDGRMPPQAAVGSCRWGFRCVPPHPAIQDFDLEYHKYRI